MERSFSLRRRHLPLEIVHCAGAEFCLPGGEEDALACGQHLPGLFQRLRRGSRATEAAAHDPSLGLELPVLGDLGLDGAS